MLDKGDMGMIKCFRDSSNIVGFGFGIGYGRNEHTVCIFLQLWSHYWNWRIKR